MHVGLASGPALRVDAEVDTAFTHRDSDGVEERDDVARRRLERQPAHLEDVVVSRGRRVRVVARCRRARLGGAAIAASVGCRGAGRGAGRGRRASRTLPASRLRPAARTARGGGRLWRAHAIPTAARCARARAAGRGGCTRARCRGRVGGRAACHERAGRAARRACAARRRRLRWRSGLESKDLDVPPADELAVLRQSRRVTGTSTASGSGVVCCARLAGARQGCCRLAGSRKGLSHLLERALRGLCARKLHGRLAARPALRIHEDAAASSTQDGTEGGGAGVRLCSVAPRLQPLATEEAQHEATAEATR